MVQLTSYYHCLGDVACKVMIRDQIVPLIPDDDQWTRMICSILLDQPSVSIENENLIIDPISRVCVSELTKVPLEVESTADLLGLIQLPWLGLMLLTEQVTLFLQN